MSISKKNAKALAVSYAAYQHACNANDDNEIAVWGDSLLDAQKRTGVEMYSPDTIERLVTAAYRKLAKAPAAA